jgi:hypothetical protein
VVGRTNRDEQLELAIEELRALDALHIAPAGPRSVSLEGRTHRWTATVHAYDNVDESLARALTRDGPGVVVANRITASARAQLESQGWCWLDRRIGAHLVDEGRDIEVRFADGRPPARRGGIASGAIRGRAGVALGAALLCAPEKPPSLRSVAASVGMSPQSVANAAACLRDAGLLEADRRPAVPELFWALAEVWRPGQEAGVASLPDDHSGWVLAGDQAAAALGAPVVNLDERPLLWAPDPVTLRRAERRFGRAAEHERVATLALAPTELVTSTATEATPWSLPHPVFAALDLARDRGRGREILDAWSPEGVDVVWR